MQFRAAARRAPPPPHPSGAGRGCRASSLFRNRGWLRATTAVGEARFAGRVAELPVGITTGPLFHIGNVEIHGALVRSAAAVRAAVALDAGGVYTEGAVAAARARIATSYRSAGHEAARVTARSVVDDAAGRVNVRFDISEGPRQVVETVVIEGAPRTHPALVARALDLNPGAAVDPAAWNLGAPTPVQDRRVPQRRHPGAGQGARWRRRHGRYGAGRGAG